VVDLKAKLSGMTYQANDLVKENAFLKSKAAALHEHIGRWKRRPLRSIRDLNPTSIRQGVTMGTILRTFEN